MPADLRLPKRAAVVVTSLLLIVGATGVVAAPSSAVPSLPSPSPSAPVLSPGLYVNVISGLISLSNSSGYAGFSAGQFGYINSTPVRPVLVPSAPALSFAPPAVFQPAAKLLAAQQAAQPAADASARAAALVAQANAARAAADARSQAVQDAAAQVATAGAQKETEWAANQLAQQKALEATAALDAARAAADGAAEGAEADAAEAAAQAAEAALAAAAQDAEAAAEALAAASVAADAAHAAEEAAAQLAQTAQTQSEQAAQAADSATDAATALLAATIPAIPVLRPEPTVAPTASGPMLAAGQHMILAAAGFAPSTLVAFGIYSTPLSVAPVSVDAQGFAVAPFQIPSSFTGNHSLVAVGTGLNGLQRILRIDVVVQAAPAATDSSATLADTGADLAVPFGGAVVVLLLGTALFAHVRRRRAV